MYKRQIQPDPKAHDGSQRNQVIMAKKTVATLQTKSKRLTKAIKMVRSDKTGAYTYVETILAPELVNDWLSKK